MKYIIIEGNDVLLSTLNNLTRLPEDKDLNPTWIKEQRKFPLMGSKDTQLLIIKDFKTVKDFSFVLIRSRTFQFDGVDYNLIIQAKAIHSWNIEHQYCGSCGLELLEMKADKSKTCPNCNKIYFPELSTAIIVGIKKGKSLLMAHNANFPEGLYSLIAGFVELGETFEEAANREIMEEVGIKVKNIQYIKSQPWPFPHSLMIGFIADYDEGEINPDNIEILDADWFTKDNLPPSIPNSNTIAREIINFVFKEQ
jgi:NAD+ diphosphatase